MQCVARRLGITHHGYLLHSLECVSLFHLRLCGLVHLFFALNHGSEEYGVLF
jgi:hypothetical protein